MPEDLPEPKKSEEFQNFEKLAKGLFAVPKEELDEQIKADNKKARKRVAVKTTPRQAKGG